MRKRASTFQWGGFESESVDGGEDSLIFVLSQLGNVGVELQILPGR